MTVADPLSPCLLCCRTGGAANTVCDAAHSPMATPGATFPAFSLLLHPAPPHRACRSGPSRPLSALLASERRFGTPDTRCSPDLTDSACQAWHLDRLPYKCSVASSPVPAPMVRCLRRPLRTSWPVRPSCRVPTYLTRRRWHPCPSRCPRQLHRSQSSLPPDLSRPLPLVLKARDALSHSRQCRSPTLPAQLRLRQQSRRWTGTTRLSPRTVKRSRLSGSPPVRKLLFRLPLLLACLHANFCFRL